MPPNPLRQLLLAQHPCELMEHRRANAGYAPTTQRERLRALDQAFEDRDCEHWDKRTLLVKRHLGLVGEQRGTNHNRDHSEPETTWWLLQVLEELGDSALLPL